MAYNPTTWGSNDVITKDRLNKMEQGVRTGTLLSGTDIDTDKDWNNKAITNLGSLTSHGKTIINSSGELAGGGAAYILYADPACAAANICAQTLSEAYTYSDNYAQLLVLTAVPAALVVGATHQVHVAWEHKASYSGYVAASRIYVNGAAVGPIHSTSSTSYSVVSDTITVSPGDVITIWGRGITYEGVWVYVRNVKVFAFAVPAGRPPMW